MSKGTIWIIVGVFALLLWVIGGCVLSLYLYERNVLTDYHLRFGILSEDANGNVSLEKETTVVPLRYKDPKIFYGTEITPPDDKPYTYYCIFHFSAPPKVVSGPSFEGKEPSATLQTNPVNVPGGPTFDENWFDPGDPMGEQSVDVYINGRLVKTFNYTVIPDN